MGNYHYIIAGLPELILNADNKSFSYNAVRDSVLESSSEEDRRFIEWLEFGNAEDNLSSHFYRAAAKCKNRFIRKYFALDLEIRNRKVDFVAAKMNRDAGAYKMPQAETAELGLCAEELERLSGIFANKNILEKEQLLDKFKWDYISSLNDYGEFNMDVILAFLAKGQLIERWNRLDRKAGEEMFRKLVDEVRGTYNGVENKKID